MGASMDSAATPPAEPIRAPVPLPRENVYGSLKRLDWIRRSLAPGDRVVDLGCGTGYMITLPLLLDGVDVTGVDLDRASIARGRQILRAAGQPPERLRDEPLEEITGCFDVAILSEVLEHQSDAQLDSLLGAVGSKLRPGGRLLVTVPNGYGWFELESALWYRAGLGRLLTRLNVVKLVGIAHHRLTGGYVDAAHPSSLEGSPHVQRFTPRSIRARLEAAGFGVESVTGTAIFAGPFSAMLFTGLPRFMRANNALATRFPRLASGFLVSARAPGRHPNRS